LMSGKFFRDILRKRVEVLSFLIELNHPRFKKTLEGAAYSKTLKSRIRRKHYHWCEDNFIIGAQTILFGQLVWPSNNEVVQVESNVGL
jgi:hypothetical protein